MLQYTLPQTFLFASLMRQEDIVSCKSIPVAFFFMKKSILPPQLLPKST